MNSAETAELFRTAQKWSGTNGVASAVVVRTWRTAPRPVGGRLIVRDDDDFAGSVSGGCVEKEVIFAAKTCIQNRQCQMLSFGIADETAWQSGLSCGGEIEIFVAPFPSQRNIESQQAVADFLCAVESRKSGVLVTDLHNGNMRFLMRDVTYSANEGLLETLPQEFSQAFALNLEKADKANPLTNINDNSKIPNQKNTTNAPLYFVEWCAPSWQLFIIGATHIAQALAPMAAACGFAVTVIDPRSGFANPQRFANTKLLAQWPDESFDTLPLDSRTAVITLSHDPKIDEPALAAALRADVSYIGALGSVRTRARRNQRLLTSGFADADIRRIHAPIGLDIGAQTAAEIAVSIIAEMISVCTNVNATENESTSINKNTKKSLSAKSTINSITNSTTNKTAEGA